MPQTQTPDPSVIPNDPLFSKEWFLLNPKNNGYDLNLLSVWKDYTGAGVKIAVCDDGIQSSHPDLIDNYDPALSYNFVKNRPSGDPTSVDSNHGTSVAGVIAGVANNGKGVVGVAYGATLGSIIGDTLDEIASSFDFAVEQGADIINNSWGFDPFQDGGSDAANLVKSMESAVANGRHGLGTLMTFAAGNERDLGWDANLDAVNSSPYAIAVAAANQDGKLSSYSTPGASVLITGFGGESENDNPGLVTTDRTARAGYTSGDYYLSDYDGAFGFNGTSAATPTVSGVIALMLEANPDLGYRDVQEILAYSARNTDPSSVSWNDNHALNWNGGGLHTSRDFGFGVVDALAAVRLAETWDYQSTFDNLSTNTATSKPLNQLIPDASNRGISSALKINKNLELDDVTVTVHLRHYILKDLQIDLVSPSGTRSTLLDNTDGELKGQNLNWTFTSTQFWGESSLGNWKLIVMDQSRGVAGKLIDWSITAYGDDLTADNASQDNLYVYTNEFAGYDTAQDATRRILNDATGNDTINAAAITDAVYLDLTPGKTSRLAGGNTLQIGNNTLMETAYTGDGNDQILGNSADNWLDAGRGLNSVDGGAGNDTLIGGKGLDQLTGGSGADDFLWMYSNLPVPYSNLAYSTITDFSPAEGDQLDLSALDGNLKSPYTVQPFTFIGTSNFSSAGQLRWDTGNFLLEGDRDGDTIPDFAIKLLGLSQLPVDALILTQA